MNKDKFNEADYASQSNPFSLEDTDTTEDYSEFDSVILKETSITEDISNDVTLEEVDEKEIELEIIKEGNNEIDPELQADEKTVKQQGIEIQALVVEYQKTQNNFVLIDIYRHPSVRRIFNAILKRHRWRTQSNIRLHRSGFFRYENGLYSDPVQEVFNTTLLDAIEKFDETGGRSFTTYIFTNFDWRIKTAINRETANFIKGPDFSIDEEVGDDEKKTRGDFIEVENKDPIAQIEIQEEFRKIMLEFAEKLDPMERFILHVRELKIQMKRNLTPQLVI